LAGSDDNILQNILNEIGRARRAQEAQRRREAEIMANPDSVEAQKLMEERIRQQNIDQNMETAMEHLPEAFGSVVMLYINASVNTVPIKAFVDSGAQQTIMSKSCAERCGLMRLVDPRFAGVAKGVGTAKILGRVHVAQLSIGGSHFNCSFTVLEDQGIDFLLGLDFLKRFQCCIDLKDNVLRVGEETVPFLSEHDIPLKEKMGTMSPEELKQIEDTEMKDAVEESIRSTGQPSQPFQGQGHRLGSAPPASSTPTTQAPSSSSASSANPSQYPPEVIQSLVNLGYPRENVLAALEAAGGNADIAASILMGI
jgi:DNA damage-inducible protein 1